MIVGGGRGGRTCGALPPGPLGFWRHDAVPGRHAPPPPPPPPPILLRVHTTFLTLTKDLIAELSVVG